MKPFAYASAANVDDLIDQLGREGARPLAGGTDLLTLMKADLVAPSQVLDLKRAQGVPAGISEDGAGLVLGALTSLAEIEHSPIVRERYTALAEAAGQAATPQLRNMATIGGNLLQRPRCWYFRNRHVDCWLKGGADCPARDGENALHAIFETSASPCVAVHPSDPAAALLALDASITVRGRAGERSLELADFLVAPTAERRVETTLGSDEVLLSIALPRPRAGARSTYHKAMDRAVWAFALVGAAVRVTVEAGRVADARVVLGGVAPVPWRAASAERVLVGAAVDDDLPERAAAAAFEGAQPLGQNGYKVRLGQGLVRQALHSVLR